MAFKFRPSRLVLAGVLSFGFVAAAYAIIPLIATGFWLVATSAYTLSAVDVGLAVGGTIAGVLIAECDPTGKPLDPTTWGCTSGAQTPAVNTAIKVDLRPDGKRTNPDPKRYTDNAAKRDVDPKDSYQVSSGMTTMPSNYPAVVQAVGGAGTMQFARYNYSGGLSSISTVEVTTVGKAGMVSSWSGSVVINGTSQYFYVYDGIAGITCVAGYQLVSASQPTCQLIVPPAEVKKPTTQPCELIYDSATKKTVPDPANPNCTGVETVVKNSSDGKSQEVTDKTGAVTKITPKDGGGFKITKTDLGGGWKSVDTAPYDSSQKGYPIVSSSSGSGPGTNPDSPSTGPNAPGGSNGTGTGTGTGTTGSGSGDCAGYGCAKEATQQEVLTSVREITKAADPAAVTAAYDSEAKAAALVTDLQSRFKTPSDYSGITSHITANLGLPPGGQCSNAVFNWTLIGRPMVVDFQWLCVPIAPIVNWFFWMLVTITAVSEVLYILTGRGLPGDNIDAGVTDQQASDYIT